MPIHDWSRVEAGIFHAFHHSWIEEIHRALNAGILPPDYYALPEQRAVGFGPDVLTLQHTQPNSNGAGNGPVPPAGPLALLVERPRVRFDGEIDRGLGQKSSAVAVRHVSDDRVVAVVEVVSPANKTRHGLPAFVTKAAELLDAGVHLLVLDLLPPGRYDPFGVHVAVWEAAGGDPPAEPFEKPLTLAAYESADVLRFYLEPVGVGDALSEMPLFLVPGGHVHVPLEATYQRAVEALPRRWRQVLELPQ